MVTRSFDNRVHIPTLCARYTYVFALGFDWFIGLSVYFMTTRVITLVWFWF